MERPMVTFVEDLTTTTQVEIIHDWDQFEREGAIGDCKLRAAATRFLNENNWPESMVTVAMHALVFEICRAFAKEFIHDNGLDNC